MRRKVGAASSESWIYDMTLNLSFWICVITQGNLLNRWRWRIQWRFPPKGIPSVSLKVLTLEIYESRKTRREDESIVKACNNERCHLKGCVTSRHLPLKKCYSLLLCLVEGVTSLCEEWVISLCHSKSNAVPEAWIDIRMLRDLLCPTYLEC